MHACFFFHFEASTIILQLRVVANYICVPLPRAGGSHASTAALESAFLFYHVVYPRSCRVVQIRENLPSLQTFARINFPNPSPTLFSFSSRLLVRDDPASLAGDASLCLRLDSELPVEFSVSLRLRSLRTGVGDAVRSFELVRSLSGLMCMLAAEGARRLGFSDDSGARRRRDSVSSGVAAARGGLTERSRASMLTLISSGLRGRRGDAVSGAL
jgi:hypothetical protein